MKIKRLLIFSLLPLLLLSLVPQGIFAATIANTFQITTDSSQQTSPFIYQNLTIYTSNSDIWGYNLRTKENFPILEKDGFQFTTDLYRNLIIYEDTPPSEVTSDVRAYNLRTGEDTLIADGPGSQTSGVTNGREVVYIDGGACGSLNAYNLRRGTTTQIFELTCHPVRMWQNIVVFHAADPGGTDIWGYDLVRKQLFPVATSDGFQEAPNIYGHNVVWLQRFSGAYGDYNAIVMKNLVTGKEKILYESSTNSLAGPAISNRYVVWSESSAQHVGGVQAADLKTGEVFEVQAQGSHQNSHTMPDIWRDTAVWQAWRTGNGDIYGSEFEFSPPSP